LLVLVLVIVSTAGCGGFVARRIAQAPNLYPQWVAPEGRVKLKFSSKFLSHFPTSSVQVGPPDAQLTYRVIEPAHYGISVTSSNWLQQGRPHFKFAFDATVPGNPNRWSAEPRGTVILLHGHGLAQFSTAPWALRLAEEGWRCVLVNLRGHGTSTGNRVYFGTREHRDLSQLLDVLDRDGLMVYPVSVLGESYGATVALRWKAIDPRISSAVAIAPYARLDKAILNIRKEYARWVPRALIQAGLNQLPVLLQVDPDELNPIAVLKRNPVHALFLAGEEDRITPVREVRRLYENAAPGSRLVVAPGATHEAVAYFFQDLVPPVLEWLEAHDQSAPL
jgi:pimeloyl-ACP methyl ester carboxylesterase